VGDDRIVVVIELHFCDVAVRIGDPSVDADAGTGLGLQGQGGGQSDDLGDLHDGRWSGRRGVIGFEVM